MKLLDRYIAKTVLSTIALVTLILIGLQLFILFVNELDDLGRGQYHITQALSVMLLSMPGEVYLFFPVACLLGALMGLGNLASHHELIVMQAAGVSIKRVTWSVLKASIIVVVFVALLGEVFAPRFLALANEKRWEAINNGQAMQTLHGVWLKSDNDFIVIGDALSNKTLQNIEQFHFDARHQLQFARQIERLTQASGEWRAYGIEETHFQGDKTRVKTIKSMPWDIPLDMVTLRVGGKQPDELDFLALKNYVKSKHGKGLFFHYKLAYWQRLVQPFTTVVMMVLAIPFVFGPLRSSTMGAKLLAGASVGFGFHLANRFFGPLADVLNWPPELAAVLPTVVFALIGLYWMGRVR
ncbi:MAG: LPS export ABC transporter permease LptG [Gammaproteobacteria bacterium]|nr:LPS export ABC transporter permease LptG [Gammaproteobacteria bacterium]